MPNCELCGAEIDSRRKKYCDPCKAHVAAEQKAAWYEKNKTNKKSGKKETKTIDVDAAAEKICKEMGLEAPTSRKKTPPVAAKKPIEEAYKEPTSRYEEPSRAEIRQAIRNALVVLYDEKAKEGMGAEVYKGYIQGLADAEAIISVVDSFMN